MNAVGCRVKSATIIWKAVSGRAINEIVRGIGFLIEANNSKSQYRMYWEGNITVGESWIPYFNHSPFKEAGRGRAGV